MRSFAFYIVTGAALGLLSACANQYELAEIAEPQGPDFNRALYTGYLDLADGERNELDWRDSDHFAGKALAAANGGEVAPDEITSRALPEDSQNDLSAARDTLTSALDQGGRDKAPGDAAAAQVAFDCWLQEQEENIQPDDIAACRSVFEAAIARLEDDAGAAQAASAIEPSQLPGPFVVHFAFDSAELSGKAAEIVKQAAVALSASGASRVMLSGHTDRAGSQNYNLALSQQRAEAVARLLQSSGIKAELIGTAGYGKSRPSDHSKDERRQADDRRVEIAFVK